MEAFILKWNKLISQRTVEQAVKHLDLTKELFVRNASVLDVYLSELVMTNDSLLILYILDFKIQRKNMQIFVRDTDGAYCDLRGQVLQFLMDCNAVHIRCRPTKFANLCRCVASALIANDTPLIGIFPLLRAITKLQSSDSYCLTSIHSDVLKLSIAAKCFSQPIIQLLSNDYASIGSSIPADMESVLLFFYYGGVIHACLKNFSKALFFFEFVVSLPAGAMSLVMLEAYKKFLLVYTLLEQGSKLQGLPRSAMNSKRFMQLLPGYTSPIVHKLIQPLCDPYHQLVSAFLLQDSAKLENVITTNKPAFERDNNLGLVRQVAVRLIRSKINRLSLTYNMIRLDSLVDRVFSDEAETIVASMIDCGVLYGKVSHLDGVIQFQASPSSHNSIGMLCQLKRCIEDCIALDTRVCKATLEEQNGCTDDVRKKEEECSNTNGHIVESSDKDKVACG